MKEKLEKFAKDNNCILNPDKELVNGIIKALILNEKKHGFSYCPCRAIPNPVKDPNLVCPCDFLNSKVWKEKGRCHCELFLRK